MECANFSKHMPLFFSSGKVMWFFLCVSFSWDQLSRKCDHVTAETETRDYGRCTQFVCHLATVIYQVECSSLGISEVFYLCGDELSSSELQVTPEVPCQSPSPSLTSGTRVHCCEQIRNVQGWGGSQYCWHLKGNLGKYFLRKIYLQTTSGCI
jgi:hypothetical protein